MIQIVEDDPVVRLLLERIAHRLRQATVSASTLAEAIEQLDRVPVDAVVCDLSLPDGDGLDLIARLRAHPRLADVPVTFCTSRADLEAVQRAIELNAVDFIRKPLDIPDVMTRLERLLVHAPQRWLAWPELRARFQGDPRAWRAATAEARRLIVETLALAPGDAAFAESAARTGEACDIAGGVRGAALVARFAHAEGPNSGDAQELRAGLAVELAALDARAAA